MAFFSSVVYIFYVIDFLQYSISVGLWKSYVHFMIYLGLLIY